jgi:hypothetical protein
MVIIITIVCFVSFIWGEAGVVKFGHLSNDRAHISLALGCHNYIHFNSFFRNANLFLQSYKEKHRKPMEY